MCQEVRTEYLCLAMLLISFRTAGGYDAIYLLIAEPEETTPGSSSNTSAVAQVEKLWQDWKELSVCPLASRADAGGLKVIEHPEEIKGLKEVVARLEV